MTTPITGYGDLGNLIFEYASTTGIALRTEHTAVFGTNFLPLLDLFPALDINICGERHLLKLKTPFIKQKGKYLGAIH